MECGSRTERAQNGHSSRGGDVSIGPSAFDRRTGAVGSPVRSHRAVRSQPSEPRRHHCRPGTPLNSPGGSPRPVLAGLPRCRWQLGASGCCQKVPNIATEPCRALGAMSWEEPARRVRVQPLFETGRWFGRGTRATAKNSQLRLSAHPTASSARSLIRANTNDVDDHFIFQATFMEVEQETKMCRTSTKCARLPQPWSFC
jgi:hypothetical protein